MSLAEEILGFSLQVERRDPNGAETSRQYVWVRNFLFGVFIAWAGWGAILYAEVSNLVQSGASLKLAAVALLLQAAIGFIFGMGWNRRFADPSLTVLQVVSYIALESVAVLVAPSLRHSIPIWYCLSLTIGLASLRFSQALGIALLVLAAHVTALAFLLRWGDIQWSLPVEVFALSALVCYLISYCAVARFLDGRRKRQMMPGETEMRDLRLEAARLDHFREVDLELFCTLLRQHKLFAADRQLALIHITVADSRRLAGEYGRKGLQAIERHLLARVRSRFAPGGVLCATGRGVVLALAPAATEADALAATQQFCRSESDSVVLLPEIAAPIALQLRGRSELLRA